MHSCLHRVPIFKDLSIEEMNQVHDYLTPKHLSRGEFVQIAGDYNPTLMVLNRGKAKVSRTSTSGEEQTIRVLEPGDYVGETAVFAGSAANYDVRLLEDSSFCTLDKDHLSKMIADYPNLAIKILGDMSKRLESAESQIESLALKGADERLYDLLVEYSGGEREFELGQSKKDIAAQIGVRPETLSRSLKRLQDEGLISYAGKSITIKKRRKN